MIKKLIVFVSVFLLVACGDSNTCQSDINTFLVANALQMTIDDDSEQMKAVSVYLPFVVHGVGNDSLLYQNSSVSSFSLPLNKFDSISEFVFSTPLFQVRDSVVDTVFVNDTISFYHQNEMELVSLECGCKVNYVINAFSYTVNAIDSVVLVSNEVQTGTKNNVNIYIKK